MKTAVYTILAILLVIALTITYFLKRKLKANAYKDWLEAIKKHGLEETYESTDDKIIYKKIESRGFKNDKT